MFPQTSTLTSIAFIPIKPLLIIFSRICHSSNVKGSWLLLRSLKLYPASYIDISKPSCFGLVVKELQLECPPLDSSLGHCGIHIWTAASETEDRYAVSHLVTFGSMLVSVSSLDHHGGNKILGYPKNIYI